MNNEAKAEVFDTLFSTGALDAFVIEDLKLSYSLTWPDDWEYRDALRVVLKAYLVEKDYNEWLESVA